MAIFKCDKYCPERAMGCHSSCKRYKAAKEKNEQIKHKKRLDNEVNTYIASSIVRKIEKNRGKKWGIQYDQYRT